ncbi:MAG: GMC family oxidoreductase N-terminal domain-containing protein [Novosphingobium sp.]|nr:GMC family oxidoreductase N-terminal domain-containing protein [Novosphingobium sp.]
MASQVEIIGECDFIVVGSGSSGGVLAARLSEDGTQQVTLLEAGGSDRHPMIAMPLVWMKTLDMPQFGWGTQSIAEANLDGRTQPLPRGKVLGGTSSINGGMYIRGAAADYDAWRDLGLPGWGYSDVLPYFKRAETNWRGETEYHGGSGPLHATQLKRHPELFPAFLNAAESLGHQELEDFNVPEPEGFGMPDCNIRNGRRASTATAYLRPALGRHNLQVETCATATRIVLEDGRAVGVEFEREGSRHIVRARREVILCAGAFHSPHLLMLSGIGPARQLSKHGIKVRVDSPNVGANLQDHPIALSFWAAAKPVTFERELRFDRLAFNVLRWALTGKGTPSQSPLTIQGFMRSGPAEERPDIQFQVSHVLYDARPWFPLIRKGAGHAFSSGAILLNPESRGRVSLSSPDPHSLPEIALNFLEAESDLDKLRAMIRFSRDLFNSDPLRDYVAAETAPGVQADSDGEIDAWLRSTVMSAAHPTSTCAMGVSDDAVLDAELRVRGVNNLRVVDCSAMPSIVRGNTSAPATMMAEKASDLILGRMT